MSFVFLQFVGQLRLVAESHVVKPVETGYPVAMLQLSIALQVVLASCEVPHEISPVHEVALVGEEESDVFQLCRHLHAYHLSAAVVRHIVAINSSHPALVCPRMCRAIHTWEEHVLSILVVVLCADNEV